MLALSSPGVTQNMTSGGDGGRVHEGAIGEVRDAVVRRAGRPGAELVICVASAFSSRLGGGLPLPSSLRNVEETRNGGRGAGARSAAGLTKGNK